MKWDYLIIWDIQCKFNINHITKVHLISSSATESCVEMRGPASAVLEFLTAIIHKEKKEMENTKQLRKC